MAWLVVMFVDLKTRAHVQVFFFFDISIFKLHFSRVDALLSDTKNFIVLV